MNSIKLLSDLTVHLKYARYLPHLKRRETWAELVARNKNMHLQYYQDQIEKYPLLKYDIDEAYKYVEEYKILPSMRSMQNAGRAILEKNARMYNCCYIQIDNIICFAEIMYLLLCGTGNGYSVQFHHIAQLPKITLPMSMKDYYIQDSIEGWADAVLEIFKAFTDEKTPLPIFKGDLVRPRGALITSVGKMAPGPEELLNSLQKVEVILRNAIGRKLEPIEVMDCINILSESVISAGVRRSALICFFSPTDEQMLQAKSGTAWYTRYPWRARSNNSAVILRSDPLAKIYFEKMWSALQNSGSGEPGVFFTNDLNVLSNPCAEISLVSNNKGGQMCNLTEIAGHSITDQADLNKRSRLTSLLGTLQAGYVNFGYLRPGWVENVKRDSLLGCSITGIAHGYLETLNLKEAATHVVEANNKYSKMLGINRSARTTCLKPSGSTSLVFGSSSGIHAIHSKYYIRRLRIGKEEPVYQHLVKYMPNLVEDEIGKEATSAVLKIPQAMIFNNAAYRNENVHDLLNRIYRFNTEWVAPGHVDGINRHNVSGTISIRETDWNNVKNWFWGNRNVFQGLTCLPYSNVVYKQMPFEECTKSEYNELYNEIKYLNLEEIREEKMIQKSNEEEPACAGGYCELK